MNLLTVFLSIFVFVYAQNDIDFLEKKYIPKRGRIFPLEHHKPQDISPYIVGGTEADPHSHPWTAALYIDDRIFCGGVLISNQWVLSVAHCFNGASEVIVQLGAHNRTANETTQLVITSGNTLHIHRQSPQNPFGKDIALIQLAEPVEFSDAIKPIQLPEPNDSDIGEDVTLKIAGWGSTTNELDLDNHLNVNDVLMEVDVLTISNSDCQSIYGDSISEAVLCSNDSFSGSCFGDAGGPLTYYTEEGPVLRGLISYLPSAGCDSIYPHLFTRVKYHLQWIKDISGI